MHHITSLLYIGPALHFCFWMLNAFVYITLFKFLKYQPRSLSYFLFTLGYILPLAIIMFWFPFLSFLMTDLSHVQHSWDFVNIGLEIIEWKCSGCDTDLWHCVGSVVENLVALLYSCRIASLLNHINCLTIIYVYMALKIQAINWEKNAPSASRAFQYNDYSSKWRSWLDLYIYFLKDQLIHKTVGWLQNC